MIFACLLSFSACGKIKDENGEENTSLCQLTLSQLTAKNPALLEVGSIENNKNGVYSLTVNSLSGVKILYKFDASEELNYSFKATSTLKSGNLRFYVLCGGGIVKDVPVGESVTVELAGLSGITEFRIAGESANVSVTIEKN